MKLRVKKSTTFVSLCLSVLAVFGISLFLAHSSDAALAQREGGRLITLHDRGTEKVFITTKETLKEALNEQGVSIDAQDAVEPSLDEKLVAPDYRVNIYRARPVTIVDGATRQKVVTPYQSAERIAKDAEVSLYPEDTTALSRSTDLVGDGAGLQLVIDRATLITIDLYGKQTELRTQAETVGALLKEKGINLGESGRVSVDQGTLIAAGMNLRIWREGKQTVTVEEAVGYDTQQIKDADRPAGYKEIKTPGKEGKRSVTYEIIVENGAEVARREIASVALEQAVAQVEVVGAKVKLVTNITADKEAIMTAAGVSAGDQQYAAYIINNENGLWCAIRWQGSRGCGETYYERFAGAESSSQIGYGLCQATPGNKMASAGADWRTNVVTQMKWCHSYAMGRYGSWEAAYQFKVARGWW